MTTKLFENKTEYQLRLLESFLDEELLENRIDLLDKMMNKVADEYAREVSTMERAKECWDTFLSLRCLKMDLEELKPNFKS